jgi:hypothetical protein
MVSGAGLRRDVEQNTMRRWCKCDGGVNARRDVRPCSLCFPLEIFSILNCDGSAKFLVVCMIN